ncbi:Hypothetical protein ABZS17G119_00708 [Kosakonia cowanii]
MRFFDEPRAAFYTDNRVKKQNKKGLLAPLPGKFSVTECVRRRRRSKNAGNEMNK